MTDTALFPVILERILPAAAVSIALATKSAAVSVEGGIADMFHTLFLHESPLLDDYLQTLTPEAKRLLETNPKILSIAVADSKLRAVRSRLAATLADLTAESVSVLAATLDKASTSDITNTSPRKRCTIFAEMDNMLIQAATSASTDMELLFPLTQAYLKYATRASYCTRVALNYLVLFEHFPQPANDMVPIVDYFLEKFSHLDPSLYAQVTAFYRHHATPSSTIEKTLLRCLSCAENKACAADAVLRALAANGQVRAVELLIALCELKPAISLGDFATVADFFFESMCLSSFDHQMLVAVYINK